MQAVLGETVPEGMKAFGVLDFETEMAGVSFLHRFTKLPRQEHAFGYDLWLSRVRLLEHGIRRGFYSGPRETLKIVLAD